MKMPTLVSALALVVLSAGVASAEPEDLKFFEQKIRPVLVKHCYGCHSAAAKKSKGGLMLDTREAIRKGGDSGPAVVPGDPRKSLLLRAVRYDQLEMPPRDKGKLPDHVTADLERWVKMGAPDPRENSSAPVANSWQEMLKDRREWWSLRPVRPGQVPTVKNGAWSANPIDRFLLAELEKHGLQPAGDAERRTLIRRLCLVLTGLPPTASEIEAFVADPSPVAYERLVDRVLGSPHFGEHFAQHWLDVVRFSETHGSDANFEAPFAWRYRDYVIRAFNENVPYDQFVREHVAGDLLPPRWNRREQINEAPIGTVFYRFGDGNTENCIAFPEIGYDTIDNQIDTLGKAFQATTIACARCHDHKLDAVSMKDYYALVGILRSARQQTQTLDAPEVNARQLRRLRALKAAIREELAEVWQREAEQIGRYLVAAQARRTKAANAAQLARGLETERLERWEKVLAADTPEDLFAPWRQATAGANFAGEWRKQGEHFSKQQHERAAFNREHFRTLADFRNGLAGWQAGGAGQVAEPAPAGDFALHSQGDVLLKSVLPAGCFTHTLSDRLNGTLRSPTLPEDVGGKRISFEVLGRHHAEVRLVSHNCVFGSDGSAHRLGEDRLYWVTVQVPKNPTALRTYVELATKFDNARFPSALNGKRNKDPENYEVPWHQAAANPHSYFGVRRVVVHDDAKLPQPELTHFEPLFTGMAPTTSAEAAERYAAVVKRAVELWRAKRVHDDEVRWIDGLLEFGLLGNSTTLSPRLAALVADYRSAENELTLPRVIHGMGDFGPGASHPLFARGEWNRPGELVPRHYLDVLRKPGEPFVSAGSGRLELAERIVSRDNPLTARVIVNRLWQHVFGRGLVPTVDDFGRNGELPSHPELLDFLATRFVEDGWSMKRFVRTLVLTRTFRLTNRPGQAARMADPSNRWLHHFAARRLEAEVIRDSMLAISGRLDNTLYGTSTDPFREQDIPFLRLFAGPLDGNGRRSVYIKHTLMDAPKFLEAFNLPVGIVMQGKRDVTNVPGQALAMLNDPFVLDQAGVWAKGVIARDDHTVSARVEYMFRRAVGRAPDRAECKRLETMVTRLAAVHGLAGDDVLRSLAVWKDVAHSLFNLKEFMYIP